VRLGYFLKVLPAMAGATLALVQPPFSAVQAQAPGPEERACVPFTREGEVKGPKTVYASCWGTGFILGTADRFRSSINLELDATIVELERGDEKRVLLLRELPDGRPILEDMESTLALAGGRSAVSDIDGLSFDLARFPTDGLIAVNNAGQQAPAPDGAQAGRPGAPSSGAVAVSPGLVNVAALIASAPAAVAAQESK
jgi:hypothetical protein